MIQKRIFHSLLQIQPIKTIIDRENKTENFLKIIPITVYEARD